MDVKLFVTLFLCAVAVQARHYGDRLDTDESDAQVDPFRRAREHGANQIRHRRRSWMNNYGYDYPQPVNPYYLDNRNDYDRNQDLLPQILRLLDEISSYVKRPPPPPQAIYVPYPVPYPVSQVCNCPSRKPVSKPNVTSRFPDMEDANQNWGFVQTEEDDIEDENDGSRPISFTPIVSKKKGVRNQPKVEHGSSQAGAPLPSRPSNAPSSLGSAPANRIPSQCEVFALSCCNGSAAQQQQCFNNAGCGDSYDKGNACNHDRILAIIDAYAQAYSPVN